MSRFLIFSTIDTWVGQFFTGEDVGERCPVHSGMLSSIPGLYPLHTSSTSLVVTKMSPDIVKCSWGQNRPIWKPSLSEGSSFIPKTDLWLHGQELSYFTSTLSITMFILLFYLIPKVDVYTLLNILKLVKAHRGKLKATSNCSILR